MTNCEICGEPMPVGEEMFKFHGYSGPCPKPPLLPRISVLQPISGAAKIAVREEGKLAVVGMIRISEAVMDGLFKDHGELKSVPAYHSDDGRVWPLPDDGWSIWERFP